MNTYLITITDTLGGEANYSWVTRHRIVAKSVQGAMKKLAKRSKLNWHKVSMDRWDSKSGSVCCFIDKWEESDGLINLDTDYLKTTK